MPASKSIGRGASSGRLPRAFLGAFVGAGLVLALGACEQTVNVRGNMPLEEDLARLNPGVHTRNDVAALLGSPSTVSTFQDSKWYYIGQKTTEFAFFAPEVLERKVVVVSFDDGGTLAETQTLSLADGKEIDPVELQMVAERLDIAAEKAKAVRDAERLVGGAEPGQVEGVDATGGR